MHTLPKRLLAAAALLGAGVLGACSDTEDGILDPGCSGDGCEAVIDADITANRTLRADTTYTISGFVKVANGATLTIEPGTRIVGDYDVPGSSLFVLRGARIVAAGTAEAPIVFTSERAPGNRQPGDWGGLVIVGNGRINRGSPTILEGTGTGAANPQVDYGGGTNDADDSGILRYVRVEFAGYATAQDAELNAFTFAAVGSGTQLDHLQAMAGLDDHYEWFGGAVDGKFLVSYESGDDHFDMSEGFSGRLQHLVAYQGNAQRLVPRAGAGSLASDPQGIENDGCAGQNCLAGQTSQPYTIPVVANFTLVGTGPGIVDATSGGVGMMLRRGTGGHYVNGIVARWPRAAVSLRDQTTLDRITAGDLRLSNLFLAENGETFQAAAGGTVQGTVELAANAIEVAGQGVTTASLFAALPGTVDGGTTAAAFDWSLVAAAAPGTGGLQAFTGALQARAQAAPAAGAVTGTAYRGAAGPTGQKWWTGWTVYARN